MNQAATTALPLPSRSDCELAALASRAGPAAFSIGIAALEGYLRMPIRLFLDCYLQPVLAFATSINDALFGKPSFQTPPQEITMTKMLRLIGLFKPFMREMVEMNYLMTDPLVMDDSALQQLIGPLRKTPYAEGIRQTLAAAARSGRALEGQKEEANTPRNLCKTTLTRFTECFSLPAPLRAAPHACRTARPGR